MTVGELRAALHDVRDEAVLICEVWGQQDFGAQLEVREAMAFGGGTDDPGVVLKLVRTR